MSVAKKPIVGPRYVTVLFRMAEKTGWPTIYIVT